MSYDKEINERIQYARKTLRKITQKEAGACLGLNRDQYQYLESRGQFTEEQVRLLAELFNENFLILYYGIDKEPGPSQPIRLREPEFDKNITLKKYYLTEADEKLTAEERRQNGELAELIMKLTYEEKNELLDYIYTRY